MYQLILTTCPDKAVATMIAEHLVNEKLAACVNLIPDLTSIYSWKGEICTGTEIQLLIKTEERLFTQLNSEINRLHPYEVVEIIALNIQQGDENYLNWISNTLK